MKIIELKNINKKYDDNPVLRGIDLTVNAGDFITLVGRSGCGKTTLLKMINGLLKPDSGEVLINGEDINETNILALRRKMGYVIQSKGLFPHMNVEKNITYVPRISGETNRQENRKLAEEMIELVELEMNMLSRYPDELSGGQQQRVGIARALAAKPEIILMDEPFSSLDEITKKTMQDVLLDIKRKLNITIVFVTHDINEAMKLSNRMIIMDSGEIIQSGAPDYIRDNPADRIVSELIN